MRALSATGFLRLHGRTKRRARMTKVSLSSFRDQLCPTSQPIHPSMLTSHYLVLFSTAVCKISMLFFSPPYNNNAIIVHLSVSLSHHTLSHCSMPRHVLLLHLLTRPTMPLSPRRLVEGDLAGISLIRCATMQSLARSLSVHTTASSFAAII